MDGVLVNDHDPHFEVYTRHTVSNAERLAEGEEVTESEYGWRFRAANGQISAVSGEGFTRRADAHRAVRDFVRDLAQAQQLREARIEDYT